MRTALLALTLAACGGDEPHECDAGTPTCDSSLVVLLPDPRTDFTITVSDDNGLDLVITCPDPDTGADVFGDYTVICGEGRVTIETFRSFSTNVVVRLEETFDRTFTPDYQKGGDYCGNVCTTGTIQL